MSRHRLMLSLLVLVALASGPVTSAAQTPPDDREDLIKALLVRIDKLEQRVAQLEAQPRPVQPAQTVPGTPAAGGAGASAAEPPVPRAAGQPALEAIAAAATHAGAVSLPHDQPSLPADVATRQEAQPPGGEEAYPSLKLRGFTDVDYSKTGEKGTPGGFNLGQFVFHLSSALSKKISVFGELSFTPRSTGFNLEVERSIVRYDYNDALKISFGRYHTPINYWNTAFHHGLWLQTTISRPEMIQFGGRFLPVHFVGLLLEGNVPSGGLGIGYNAGIGNGRASLISRAGDAGDSNGSRAWLATVFARPAALYGLQVGGSIYRDRISPDTGPVMDEWITSAHVVWTKEHPELLAEFANVHHRDVRTQQLFDSRGFYVQAAYRLPLRDGRWKPYYRFEYINTAAGEPVLAVPDLNGSTLGVRYDISTYAAFKGEYRNTRRQAGTPRVNGLFLQTAFTF